MSSFLHQLREDPAGRRFRNAHARAQRWPIWRRMAIASCGLLVIAAGIVMLVAPGPGLVAIALGFGMLGIAARPLANVLDRGEIVGRRRVRKMDPKTLRKLAWAVAACAALAAFATFWISWSVLL